MFCIEDMSVEATLIVEKQFCHVVNNIREICHMKNAIFVSFINEFGGDIFNFSKSMSPNA